MYCNETCTHEPSKNYLISILLFFLAGLCEIGGGYLAWLWLVALMSFFARAVNDASRSLIFLDFCDSYR
ncbi:MAG: hypothetical protein KC444_03865 [Nitrosopumilus sp.]|nr:hypothetical protein [Nitrosopumilus sp.]